MKTQPLASGQTFAYYRDLILALLVKESNLHNKTALLRFAWSVLHPLVLAFILFNVFRFFVRDVPDYGLFLIAGLFPWQWIANTCAGANRYVLGNAGLRNRTQFRRAMPVVAGVLNEALHFAVAIPVIVGFMLYCGRVPHINWLWAVPTLLLLQVLMMLGIGLTIATGKLFFPDCERFVGLGIQMLFFLTPIVYPIDRIPLDYVWISYANPLAAIVICWQKLFYATQVPVMYLSVAMAWTAGLLAVGLLVYGKKA